MNCTCGTPFAEHGPGACFDLAIATKRGMDDAYISNGSLYPGGVCVLRSTNRLFTPTTSWADAGPLLEEMAKDYQVSVVEHIESGWLVNLSTSQFGQYVFIDSFADSLPLAISRAYMEWERD